MWLPKDERKLLKCYYNKSEGTRETFEIGRFEVAKSLGLREDRTSAKDTNKIFDTIGYASRTLMARELIHFEEEQDDISILKISLTLKGFDLGRKYCSKPHTILLWCSEYKVWVILGVIIGLAGIIISILVAILKD